MLFFFTLLRTAEREAEANGIEYDKRGRPRLNLEEISIPSI